MVFEHPQYKYYMCSKSTDFEKICLFFISASYSVITEVFIPGKFPTANNSPRRSSLTSHLLPKNMGVANLFKTGSMP